MEQQLAITEIRETLQMRLLAELMTNTMSKELVLKGGMAMRAVHGSVRYTKDIDLDADIKFSKERIQGIVKRAIQRTISSGLIVSAEVTEPKQTDTTLRWKINGKHPGSVAPLQLTVEVSRRPSLVAGNIIEVPLREVTGENIGNVKIQVLNSRALAFNKILALTDPMRTAPRDLFDLNVLIEANVADPVDMLVNLPDANARIQSAMEELWPKIESMTYDQFRHEVIPYLPKEVAASIDAARYDDMCLGVATKVEEWLLSATDSLLADSATESSETDLAKP